MNALKANKKKCAGFRHPGMRAPFALRHFRVYIGLRIEKAFGSSARLVQPA